MMMTSDYQYYEWTGRCEKPCFGKWGFVESKQLKGCDVCPDLWNCREEYFAMRDRVLKR